MQSVICILKSIRQRSLIYLHINIYCYKTAAYTRAQNTSKGSANKRNSGKQPSWSLVEKLYVLTLHKQTMCPRFQFSPEMIYNVLENTKQKAKQQQQQLIETA